MQKEQDSSKINDTDLPWMERVAMLSINPHAASIKDIARMAAELCENYLKIALKGNHGQ